MALTPEGLREVNRRRRLHECAAEVGSSRLQLRHLTRRLKLPQLFNRPAQQRAHGASLRGRQAERGKGRNDCPQHRPDHIERQRLRSDSAIAGLTKTVLEDHLQERQLGRPKATSEPPGVKDGTEPRSQSSGVATLRPL
jgi:hypothetical protein